MDYTQKRLIQKYAVPGTAVKGIFRHAIGHICQALGGNDETVNNIVHEMFGHADTQSQDNGQKGKISFADVPLDTQKLTLIQHVAIDRFTGGALDGALYNEEPIWQEHMPVKLSITCDNLYPHEAALLFHVIFDMSEGLLSLGGGSERGCGRVKLPHWPEEPQKAFADIHGTLCYNGKPLVPMTPESLQPIFNEWDAHLKKAVLA